MDAHPPLARKRLLTISRDQINMVPRRKVASGTAKLFDAIQGLDAEVQVMALAGAFVLITEASNLPKTADVLTTAEKLVHLPDEHGLHHQFDAMRFHLETELLNDSRV